jgi:hypothetical protein
MGALVVKGMGFGRSPSREILVPHVTFIVFDFVLLEKDAEFVLEIVFAVVLFLGVDVVEEGVEGRRGGREDGVAALPGEVMGFRFEPLGRTGFELFDELGDGCSAGESDGEMDVVGDAANAIAFTTVITGDRGEIGVEVDGDFRGEKGGSVLGAEDEMDQYEGEGLRHW